MRKTATVLSCLVVQLLVGILYLWSIFKLPVSAFYGLAVAQASMVQSVMMFGFVLGNLIGGYLQDKTNPRFVAFIGVGLFGLGILVSAFVSFAPWLIFVTYGGIAGMGCGFTYGSVLSCLQKWFPHNRGFASGLAVAAFGLSTVVFTPVAKALMNAFGGNMSKTFLTLSLIFLVVGLVACIFIRLPKETETPVNSGTGPYLTPKEALKESRFWLIALSLFFVNATWNIVCPVIYDLGVERGLSETSAALMLSLTGVLSAVGRLSMAAVSDKAGRTLTVMLLAALTAGCAVCLIFAAHYAFFFVIMFVAFAYGGPSATFPAMTTDLCGTKYSGTNYGMAMLWLGISSVAFNGLSNVLTEATGSFTASFVVAAVTAVITMVLMALHNILTTKADKKAKIAAE